MTKSDHRTVQPRRTKNQSKRWFWVAISAVAFVVLLVLAALVGRPSGPRDQIAPDAKVGEVHTFFSPT